MPKIEIDLEQQYPPFMRPDDIGKKLGASTPTVITSPHRTITRNDGTVGTAVNVRLGGEEGEERTFSLNKTNLRVLVGKFGDDSDKWIGEEITLVRSVANNPKTQKEVPAIRVE